MKKIGLILLAGFFLCLALAPLRAQSDDPSDTFLKAYMTAQQGEKLEHENQFKAALAKYRFAGSLLEELRKTHADWQPAIVEYRGRKVSESILRVQSKASTQEDLTTGPTPLPESAPVLPQNPKAPEPSVQVATPRSNETTVQVPNDTAIQNATKKLRERLNAADERSRSESPETR